MSDWEYAEGDEIPGVGTVTGTAHNLTHGYYQIDGEEYVPKYWAEARDRP